MPAQQGVPILLQQQYDIVGAVGVIIDIPQVCRCAKVNLSNASSVRCTIVLQQQYNIGSCWSYYRYYNCSCKYFKPRVNNTKARPMAIQQTAIIQRQLHKQKRVTTIRSQCTWLKLLIVACSIMEPVNSCVNVNMAIQRDQASPAMG